MPPGFTKLFAERLDTPPAVCGSARRWPERQLRAGQVWIAPGDYHLALTREGPR